ncbi:hypothetical protein L1049_014320 [Liquidambar formosana]|uniref:Plastid lipid-associated protein/fibrillin conserved domain-containing protein n=1 Tax=Liquidambar formosana TaxID=63359 RepID=A0AAP0RQR4_LIQFO
MSAVSGLNRGLAANEDDIQKADAAAKEIEAVGGPVNLSIDLDKLQGRWKLIYSSAFSSCTLSGSRLGPPHWKATPYNSRPAKEDSSDDESQLVEDFQNIDDSELQRHLSPRER